MLTKYLTSLTVTFNPLSATRAHKSPRLLLSFLPANAASSGLLIKSTILPRSSKAPSRIVVGFKDGREVIFEDLEASAKTAGKVVGTQGKEGGEGKKEGVLDLGRMGIADVIEEVDRHCRVLKRKEELSN